QVILNRVRNPSYPHTICGVVYQNDDWRNRFQFSFACDSIKDRVNSEYHWRVARDVAMAVTAGKICLHLHRFPARFEIDNRGEALLLAGGKD
ncbi:cell wall hydrolase, partial [Rhizobium ruizarguesonis]